jgi:glutamate racemase
MRLVDSATTTAESAADLLAERKLLNPGHAPAQHRYFVTDVPQRFRAVGERFLGRPLEPIDVVRW